MTKLHRLFARNSLFTRPQTALKDAYKESNQLNYHVGSYAYHLIKSGNVQAYRKEFMRRLRPFIDMVFEEMKDFKPQK